MKIHITQNQNIWGQNPESTITAINNSALAAIDYFDKTSELKSKELSVLLTNDKFIQDINMQTRAKNSPTNVLSFPHMEYDKSKLVEKSYSDVFGEMILAYETIKKEAEDQNKNFLDHLSHLTVHSVLHLLGYDHINDIEAEEMESIELEILEKLNIKNPYI